MLAALLWHYCSARRRIEDGGAVVYLLHVCYHTRRDPRAK